MSDEWRVRECVNQMLLYVASQARHVGATHLPEHHSIPRPLRPATRTLESHVVSMQAALATHPHDMSPVEKLMNKVLTSVRNDKFRATVQREKSWGIGELLEWWLSAGLAIRAWQAAPDGIPASTSSAMLDAVIGNLQVEDDEEWPPLWCADHARRWKLSPSRVDDRPVSWNQVGSCADDYRIRLLEWCGDPHREAQPNDDTHRDVGVVKRWAQDYANRYQGFARATLRLLGERCRFGDLDAIPSADAWHVYRPSGQVDRTCILRRPVHRRSDPHAQPVVKGWVVVPPASTLVDALRRSLAENEFTAMSNAWRKAGASLDEAGADASFGCLWPPGTADGFCSATANLRSARGLLKLGVVATAIVRTALADERKEGRKPASAEACGRITQALALEGIAVVCDGDKGNEPARLVPSWGSGFPPGNGAAVRVSLERSGVSRSFMVGKIGPPARCPDDLLVAVEELDWRSWALRNLEQHPAADPLAAVDWETIKRRLLDVEVGTPTFVNVLANAFDELHEGRLSMAPKAGPEEGDETKNWLLEALAAVEVVICRLLVGTTSGVTEGLHPPRRLDGQISLTACLDAAVDVGATASRWEAAWERSPLPFGTPCRETLREGGGCQVIFSAGTEAADEDLRLLSAPGVVDRQGPPWDAITAPLRRLLRGAVGAATPPDVATAIHDVKTACAGDAAADFDRLICLALKGDRRGVAWIQLMHSDPRFSFACHPAVEVAGERLSLRRPEAGDTLEWRDDDAAVDHDVEVRFATDSTRARRILSRGRPTGASAEACAARLVHAVRGGPTDVVAVALALQSATDRHRLFGGAAVNLADTAVTVAEGLAAAGIDMGEAAAAACTELANWCRATGARLVPAEWHPTAGIAAAGLDVERIEFHPTVPAGRVVVERFGITASDGTVVSTPALFVSAGPTPEGFADVGRLAAAVNDDDEAAARFLRCVAEFPKRALSGQAATAAPGLFDVAWKAVMAAPERADLRDAAGAVQRFLDRSHDMVVFEPRTVTDYQESWLRTRDGRPPQGERVERLLRPGLRTLDNRLVFPAIVETG